MMLWGLLLEKLKLVKFRGVGGNRYFFSGGGGGENIQTRIELPGKRAIEKNLGAS